MALAAVGASLLAATAAPQQLPSSTDDGAPAPAASTADPGSDLLSNLETHGLTFDLLYVGESFAARRLVPGNATRYRGNVDLHLALDTSRAGWWRGGTLFVDLQNGHGRNFALVQDGVSLPLSAIDSPDFTQIYEWGVEQRFASGLLRLRVGKQDTNDTLAGNTLAADFISPPFTLIPTVPLPTFPAPALGAALFVEPDADLTLWMGFFDGGPRIGGLGFDTFLDGAGGYFSSLGSQLTIHAGAAHALPGTYRLGLWRHSGAFPATGADQMGRELQGNHGAFLLVDQMLSPQPENGQRRGAGIFLQLGWAPEDRNPVSRYLGVGLTCVGIVPGRSADVAAVAFGTSRWNLFHPAGSHREVRHVELFYLARLSSWASLQPDLQVFDRGAGTAPRAWAFGLRWIVQLR